MHKWNEKKRPEYMDIAYSAERSVEDEIDRVSHSEIGTIIISYAVMFVYIAIALGHIRSWKTLLVRLHLGKIFANCNFKFL